jgi:choline-sulfatase
MRPNILWILSDELRSDALACYRRSWRPIATPNIDRIAERGILFENNFCNSPVCVSSRVSMLTATHPERNGVYYNEGAWADFEPPVRLETFPETFARAGYRTASIGKSHGPRAYRPWQEQNEQGSGMGVFGVAGDRLQAIVPSGIPAAVGGVYPEDLPYPPEAVTRNALDWLRGAGDAPFLLRISYLQPHTPVFPPALFRRLYDAADWPGHDLPCRDLSEYDRRFSEMVGGGTLTDAELKQAQADYHALVAWLDVQVGLTLSFLKTRGLDRTTIVVLTSDHGASLGENGLLSKVVFAPQSQRTPLILSWPGQLPEGERRQELSQNLDLARTFCDLAGVPASETFEGRSLASAPAPDAIFSTVGFGLSESRASAAVGAGTWRNGAGWPRRGCIRTERFRFDMNVRLNGGPVPPEEEDVFLADWRADPLELCNLATNAVHGDVYRELRTRLLQHCADGIEPSMVPVYSPDQAPDFAPPKFT